MVGDAPGADALVQMYLVGRVSPERVTVYHASRKPRRWYGSFAIQGGFVNQPAKDAAMTAVSDKERVSMFSQRVFNLVSHLIFSRWTRGYEEHHGTCEDAYAAHIGPLHLEINRCFVSDLLVAHDDAFISIRIPIPTQSVMEITLTQYDPSRFNSLIPSANY